MYLVEISMGIASLESQIIRPPPKSGELGKVGNTTKEDKMRQEFYQEHWKDEDGNPAGGVSTGKGFTISWQKGPIPRDSNGKPMQNSNGAFVEDVIQAVIGRIEFYQSSRFNCKENADALNALRVAAERLDDRTKDRLARKVEGSHTV